MPRGCAPRRIAEEPAHYKSSAGIHTMSGARDVARAGTQADQQVAMIPEHASATLKPTSCGKSRANTVCGSHITYSPRCTVLLNSFDRTYRVGTLGLRGGHGLNAMRAVRVHGGIGKDGVGVACRVVMLSRFQHPEQAPCTMCINLPECETQSLHTEMGNLRPCKAPTYQLGYERTPAPAPGSQPL